MTVVLLAGLGLAVILLLIDRSRRVRAHDALHAKTRAILGALPDLMFVQDRDGTYLDFYSPDNGDLFVPPSRFLGKTFRDVLPADVSAVVAPALERALAGEPVTVEYQLQMPEGVKSYEARLVPLAPARALSIVRDITSKKQVQHALDESQHFSQQLVETIPNVVFIYDLEQRRNIYVNDRSAAIIGYSAEEILGMGEEFHARTRHPDDARDLPTIYDQYMRAKDGETVEHVFRFRHKNGEWRWMQRCATVFARTADGRPRQMLGTATDITALKRVEDELRRLSSRLRNAQDEERRRIARELHDGVAQVLFGIGACLKSLRERTDLSPSAVAAILECGGLCDQGLKEVRLLSYVLHPPLLDETGLVPALRWFTEGFQQGSGIDIDLQASDDEERLPLPMERDLFRIVQEALGNVVRHSGSDRAVVRLTRHGGEAVLEIQDFGRGMPLPVAEAGPQSGVGILGMRERLRHVGGRLEIDSSPQGTTLTAVVPLHAEVATLT